MNGSMLFVFAAILIIAVLLFAVISLTKNGTSQLDQEKYRVKWMSIEQHLTQNQPASFLLSVLNADKLLDQALREKGYKGQTMAERLKSSSSVFSDRNAIWSAHKLRNQIAHETDVNVTYEAARQALKAIKQALKEVGAI